MTPLLNASEIIQASFSLAALGMFLLAFLILAIVVYRVKATMAFLLLMLASVCYSLPRLVVWGMGLFFQICGWKKSGGLAAWMHSWWFFVDLTFHFLFLGLSIAAFVLFIREGRRIVTPHA